MPDRYHQPIKEALVNDGWEVTDHLLFQYGRRWLNADLAATRVLDATRGQEQIAVEVKDFLNPSAMDYLQHALGQYLMYKSWLARLQPDRQIFLGVSAVAADTIFTQPGVQIVVEDYGIRLLVVDIPNRRVLRWT